MTCLFRSALAPRIQAFLDIRRALGRNGDSEHKILSNLDYFLMGRMKPGQALTRRIAEQWIDSFKHLSIGTRGNRISLLRQLCFYISRFDNRTCLIGRDALPRRTRPAPYIYTLREVRAIMKAAKSTGPKKSLRPLVISTLVGLLYATGLRIGEALKLKLADVDLRRRLLIIKESKFRKSRYAPLSISTARALAAFIRRRRVMGFSTDPSAPLFVSPQGHPYGQPRISEVFLRIIRSLGLRGPAGQRGPRIHDLRYVLSPVMF